MKNMKVYDQYRLVKAMDTVASLLNDEEGLEIWLQEGPGDGSFDEEYWECAWDDELMDTIANCFTRAIRHSGDRGWAVGSLKDMRQCGGKRG